MLGVNMECALRAAQGFVLDFPENLGVARKISFMRPICGAGLYRYRPHPGEKRFENQTQVTAAYTDAGMRRTRNGRGVWCERGKGHRGKASCHANAGAKGCQQQQKPTAYIRGYYIPPRNVVGSDSHVGATSAYIGLHLGGVITLQKVRPTFAKCKP